MSKVIACVDGSRSSPSVCDHAAWASRRLGNPLTLLHVIRNPHAEPQKDLSGNLSLGARETLLQKMVEAEEQRGKLIREQGRAILTDALERVKQAGVEDPGSLLRNDRITEVLDELQAETRLLVVGKQGQDGDKVARHIGSHLENIVRTVKTAVLVCPLEFREPERLLIAYDGSKTAHTVMERVAQSTMLKGMEAHLLMVGAPSSDNQSKLDAARNTLEANGFTVQARLQAGEVGEQVCAYRQEHDIHLLAMGAYGHSRLRQFFVGSTTTKMIMESPIALLIMR